MTRVFVSHNGCEPTAFDGSRLIQLLRNQFAVEIVSIEEAQIVVFLGCTFTQEKEAELHNRISMLVALPHVELLLVSGCYLSTSHQHSKIRYARTQDVLGVISEYLRERGASTSDLNTRAGIIQLPEPSCIVSVSDGCYGSCTFCSIKTVRGAHRSRPLEDVIHDVERVALHSNTVKLTGIETAGYGMDAGMTLGHLIREVFLGFPHLSVELGSLNPKLVCRFSEADLRLLADERITGNLHLPLQSASNEVLRAMRRGYTWETYRDLKARLMEYGARRFSTDLIAGFPGEKEDDHTATLAFLEYHELEFAQIFVYEPRPDTEAAMMPIAARNVRVDRAVELISQFVVSYMRFKNVSPEAVIRGDVLLPFNSNLNIQNEKLEHECKTTIG